ncbi:helix-turn-helix transcriptional regulator [Haloferax marisrubri]|uniref:Transcriptional regulator n=1 Tax=Haloferax marisrubri TaxID=1544719 RepID=A0A2P4NTZ7_9EURY|nr:helix-turn-helix domain-containing protein [Haloferax marisrubri]POG56558.1 transcriptional regulator [Haloferax marisrubri]
MNRDETSAQLSRLLVRRSSFVRSLAERPRDKRELADDLDTSRSTVDRVVRDLLDAGVVERVEGRYQLTCVGRCALGAYDECLDSLRGVHAGRDLLSMLPADAPLELAFLTGATVHTSSPNIPDSAIRELFSSIESAEHVYGVAPVALVGQLRPFYETATAGGTVVEMIIDDELFDRLVAVPTSRAVIVDQIRHESVTLYRGKVPFRFGLWATESEAGVVVYTDTGVGGVARNDTEDAVEWANGQFETLRENAERLTLDSLDEADERLGDG